MSLNIIKIYLKMKLKNQSFNSIILILTFLLLIQNIFGDNRNLVIDKTSDYIKKDSKSSILYEQSEIKIDKSDFSDDIILNRNDVYIISFQKDKIKENVLLTLLGNSITNFKVTASDYNFDFEYDYPNEIDFPIQKYFYNGYAVIINQKILNEFNNLKLKLQLVQYDSELIYVRTRQINKKGQTINSNDHIDVVLVNGKNEKECFSIASSDKNIENNTYALKFLTYTKNILGILKNKEENEKKEIEINKESMTHIIKQHEYNKICFELNNGEKKGSLSFELLNLNKTTDKYYYDKDNIVIYNNFTLVRDLSSQNYLPKGYALVYKTDEYKFKNSISFMNIKFHMIQSNSKLYILKCNNYPNCKYKKNDFIEEFTEYEDINGYISIKKYLDLDNEKGKNYVALVYCPEENEEDCIYEIGIKSDGELTYLYKNKISFTYVNLYSDESNIENYKINLESDNEKAQDNELYIDFNLFSGNAYIQFFNSFNNELKNYEIKYFGNKIIYIFKSNIIEENPDIFIKIFKNSSAYFSINYEIKNNENININYLKEGMLQYGKIKGDSENYYTIIDNSKNNYYPFIININTFGNNIDINDELGIATINKYPYFNLIQIIIFKKIDKKFTFSIKNNEKYNIDEENEYLYNIIYSKTKTKYLMNNGQNYINQLNENNKKATYSYMFTKRKEENNILIINFRKFSKNPVKISMNTNKNTYKTYIINRLSKIFLLKDDEIKNTCNYIEGKEGYDLCRINIQIENEDEYEITDDPSTHIDFSIQLTQNDDPINPIYLPHNIYISNLLIPDFPQKYYVDIPKYGTGKIYIDFMEGGGYVEALFSDKKNEIEENLYFDYFNKYFEITENLTKDCEEDYCKIYILISGIYMYKYNIYSKIQTKSEEIKPFLAPEYEYIYGNLQQNEIHKYITKISKETNKIILDVYCDNCEVEIKYNENKFYLDTTISKQFILDGSILGDTIDNFYGTILYYSIKIKDFNLTPEQNYNFRIISPGLNIPIIIPMTSLRNEFCKIDKDSPCYFIIPIEKYNKIDKFRIYIPNNEHVNIYHKTLSYIDYYSISENKLFEKMKDKYEQNKIDTIQTNYYENKISRNSDNFEKIYIIKVELDYSADITIISSHYNLMNSANANLQLNDYSLIYLNNINKKIVLNAYNKGFYNIEINLIKGKGKINIIDDTEKQYALDYEVQDNINLLVDSDINDKKTLEAEIDEDEEEFIIYIRSYLSDYYSNLVQLNFQKNNYFDYIDIKENKTIWPLNFYMKLNITSDDTDINDKLGLKNINLNYKFFNIKNSYSISKDIIEKAFDIKIYLVNISYINKRKLNPNEKPSYNNLDCFSNYREDITSGYSLIEAETLIKNNNYKINDYNYLYIVISPFENFDKNNKNINIMLSAFDLTDNHNIPMNEYLTMSINQETKINLGKNLQIYKNSVIELVLNDNSYNFTIISENHFNYNTNDTLINGLNDDLEYYGKTIINKKFLQKDNKNILYLYNITKQNDIKISNLLIKYRLSNFNELYYFKFNNGNVIYNNETNTLSFEKIVENNDTSQIIGETIIIYNIRIYDYSDNSKNYFLNNILSNEKPYKIIRYVNLQFDIYNSIKIDELPNGLFYLSILAEARKGNKYEYFTYNPVEIKIIGELTIVNITIDENEKIHNGKFSKSFLYRATIKKEDGDFIKLRLTHKNNYKENNNYIYASNNNQTIQESENLYKDCEFKTIDRGTSLIIPVNEVVNSILYIKIPCNDICDYVLNYKIYKKDNIKIHNNECFDIQIKRNKIYNFVYSLNDKNKASLLTMTSYSLKDFNIKGFYNNIDLNIDKTYFNGYSYIVNPSDDKFIEGENNIIHFNIEGDSIINVCHRSLINNNNDNDFKNIFVGDKIYIRIDNNNEECFQVFKTINDNISNYIITFISKTNNINVEFYNTENIIIDNLIIDEESDSIILGSNLDHFCIFKSNNTNKDSSGVLIHLLADNKENIIYQNLNMPLIKGISTRQKLKKGQYIYYRINENTQDSNSMNVHFQNVTGSTKVYYSYCNNYPECYFSLDNIDNKTEQYSINNNIYFNIDIKKEYEDIYHKSTFPVVIVFCTNEDTNDEYCTFYIEISNDKDTLLLNKNRKFYSFIQSDQEEYEYKFFISKNDFNFEKGPNNKEKELYIQLYSLTGSANINVDGFKQTEPYNKIENYFHYNNNTILFIYNFNQNIDEINIKINGEKNTYYNLFYYIINVNNEKENNIYLPSGEVYYSIITKPNLNYSYYFQDKNRSSISNYYITISPINCNLQVTKENNEINNQFIINSNETIKLCYKNDLDIKDKCEFTISAIEIMKNRNLNNLKEFIINDGIYQNFDFSTNIKFNSSVINYLIPFNQIENKNILININKNTEANLIVEYKINNHIENKTIKDYNDIIQVNLTNINITKNDPLEQLYNFIILKIFVYLEKKGREVDVNYKIKINGRNLPTYLNPEEIEFGLINKGQYIYYYLDYQNNDNFQIYFDCKGIATFTVFNDIDKNYKDNNRLDYIYYNNKYNLPKKDGFKNTNNNYINIKGCPEQFSVCQAYIVIYIYEEDENNESTLFNIYRHSFNNVMNIPLNNTIYGVLSYNSEHKYNTYINPKDYPIKIVLNCKKCKMCYYTEEPKDEREKGKNCKNPFDPSKDKYLLIQKKNNIDQINCIIFPDRKDQDEYNYYSIYLLNTKSHKYISQNVPEYCETPCNFLLPLYQFYHYNKKEIILFVPDNEQTIIYEKIIEMENNNLSSLSKTNNDKSSSEALISNKLVINIEEIKDIKNKNLFIQIQINSKTIKNENITFITSQFYKSLNTDIIPYSQNIFIINDISRENNIINNIKENNIYKINIDLIEGSGLFLLNNNNQNFNYSLSYDTRDKISLILKTNNIQLKPEKMLDENNFIFYMNINEKNKANDNDQLVFGKTNYFNYFKENDESNLFPIRLSFNLTNNVETHINFRFSKLIKQNDNNGGFINVTDEQFDFIIITYPGKKELKGKYYTDLRRGYIFLDKTTLKNQNYLEIIINNNDKNKNKYEMVSLDVTPFILDDNIAFPRNNYLEMKINNKNQTIKLSKPVEDYNNLYIEYSSNNQNDFSLIQNDNNKNKEYFGKNYYSIKDKQKIYKMSISNNTNDIGTILLKYIVKKEDITQYNIKTNDVIWNKIDNHTNTFKLSHPNIMVNNTNTNNNNCIYKVNYLIRLYNKFSFENNNKPKNILIEEEPILSFRKELNENELKNDIVEYEVNFGELIRSNYYISILGEVINDSNVEYFAYNCIEFSVKNVLKENNFDYTWIIIIIILILALIFIIYFLIKEYINILLVE